MNTHSDVPPQRSNQWGPPIWTSRVMSQNKPLYFTNSLCQLYRSQFVNLTNTLESLPSSWSKFLYLPEVWVFALQNTAWCEFLFVSISVQKAWLKSDLGQCFCLLPSISCTWAYIFQDLLIFFFCECKMVAWVFIIEGHR
jgi:hypothetical protein